MNNLLLISGVLALLILAVGWRFIHQIKRKRVLSGVWWSAQGIIVFSAFIITLLVYSNLHTYKRLTYETPIADIYVHQLGAQKFQISLSYSETDAEPQYFVLQGDQWQLDARILKWTGWANLLGLDSYYQLDRLSGRYQDVQQARLRKPSIYDLSADARGLDLWKMKKIMQSKLSFVDTLFGQGVFMPMLDGAHYEISIGQGGLLVRPINDVAKASML